MAARRLAENDRAVVRDRDRDVDRPAAADLDGLAPHLRVPPLAAELVPRGVGGIEALDEDVLVVRHRVRDAPGHVAVVAEVGETGDAGEREPDGVEVGAGEVVLVVAVRRVEGAVGIAGDEGAPGGGARPGEDPAVAPADPAGEGREGGVVPAQGLQGAGRRPAVLRAGREDQHRPRGGSRGQVGGQPRAEVADETGAPELHLPGPHLHVADLEDGEAVPRRPGLGPRAEKLELDGPDLRGVEEGIDAGRVGLEHHARLGGRPLVVDAGASVEAEPARQHVLGDGGLAHELRPSSARPSAVVLHVPQPILGVDESLGEERVVEGSGPRVRDTLAVPPDVDGARQAPESLRAREIGKRGHEVAPVEAPGGRPGEIVGHRRLP